MKKCIPIILLAAIYAACNLHAAGPVHFGIQAGANISFPFDTASDNSTRVGFNVGPTVRWDINRNWFVDGAMLLSSKPWKNEYHVWGADVEGFGIPVQTGITATTKHTPYYLELPVTAGRNFNIGKSASIFVSVGPYIACGLGGNSSLSVTYPNLPELKENLGNPFKDDEVFGHANRFQVGGKAKCGVRLLGHYSISATYQIQFNELTTEGGHDQMTSISLGYEF